jgi:plasmid stabilization system protein ParE
MSRYEVRVAPRAQAQIDEVAAWWKTNRQTAPMLVVDEFEAATERLTVAPLSGAVYRRTTFRSVRRLLLPRIRYHIYYEVFDATGLVRIVVFWHAARRRGPRP